MDIHIIYKNRRKSMESRKNKPEIYTGLRGFTKCPRLRAEVLFPTKRHAQKSSWTDTCEAADRKRRRVLFFPKKKSLLMRP
ncbi:MAG: hypothetical protein D6714_11810 [Bacteroidetes bacterium]|nr:MAG: hypothetical protein D6714_11810 [Bacteroidota bacterium]